MRRSIWATASRSVFQSAQAPKLRRLRRLARRYGTDLRFYLAVQRPTWAHDRFLWPENWMSLPAQDLVHGLDLSGSLEEADWAPWESGVTAAHFHDRMLSLFALAQSLGLPLRVHAFEHRNDGPFYEALRSSLSAYPGELTLQVGHMAQLTIPWIDFFAGLPSGVRVSFQSTPPSYAQLVEGFSVSELAVRQRYAESRRISVRYGFDGRGVFERTWPGASPMGRSCGAFFVRPNP